MPIIREFRCPKHGVFESASVNPLCPKKRCKEKPERYFSAPPAIKSERTRYLDIVAKDIAQDRKLSDLKPHTPTEATRVEGDPMAAIREGRAPATQPFLLTAKPPAAALSGLNERIRQPPGTRMPIKFDVIAKQ